MSKLYSLRAVPAAVSCFLLAAFTSLALISVGQAEQEAAPESFTADFSAVLKIDREGDLDLELKGKVIYSYPFTRIEFSHPLTQENIILILDAEKQSASLLFPDTLNGVQFDYSGKYYHEWPEGFTRFLSMDSEQYPEGWEKLVRPAMQGRDTLVSLSNGELFVDCWLDNHLKPASMEVATPDHSASFEFSSYTATESTDPMLFCIPDDYAVEQDTAISEDALPL